MKCAEVLDNPAAMEYVVEISGTPPVPTTSMRRDHSEG